MQARAGLPFCCLLDALVPPCLTANVSKVLSFVVNTPLTPLRKSYMLLLCFLLFLTSAWAQFVAVPSGSTIRLRGFADGIHGPWQVEGKVIQGTLDVGANFPVEPTQAVALGPVVGAADVYIPVTSLKNAFPSFATDALESIMYEKLKPETQRRIHFHLKELVLKEVPKNKDQPYLFDSKGDLAVAGVTNKLTMAVQVLPLGDAKLRISGATAVKMSDFKIEPPVLVSPLKTHDDVQLSFDWMVQKRDNAHRDR